MAINLPKLESIPNDQDNNIDLSNILIKFENKNKLGITSKRIREKGTSSRKKLKTNKIKRRITYIPKSSSGSRNFLKINLNEKDKNNGLNGFLESMNKIIINQVLEINFLLVL